MSSSSPSQGWHSRDVHPQRMAHASTSEQEVSRETGHNFDIGKNFHDNLQPHHTYATCYRHHAQEWNLYEEHIWEMEHSLFTPLVLWTSMRPDRSQVSFSTTGFKANHEGRCDVQHNHQLAAVSTLLQPPTISSDCIWGSRSTVGHAHHGSMPDVDNNQWKQQCPVLRNIILSLVTTQSHVDVIASLCSMWHQESKLQLKCILCYRLVSLRMLPIGALLGILCLKKCLMDMCKNIVPINQS